MLCLASCICFVRRRPNFSLAAWGISLLTPALAAAVYGLYDFEHSGFDRFSLDCADFARADVLLPTLSLYFCTVVSFVVLATFTARHFYKNEHRYEPKDAEM